MLKKYKFTTVFFTQMYKKSTQEQLSQWLNALYLSKHCVNKIT